MFKILENLESKVVLEIELPSGCSAEELLNLCNTDVDKLIKDGLFFGKDVFITGRITTYLSMSLGHKLAHVCKSINLFVQQENNYILVIKH